MKHLLLIPLLLMGCTFTEKEIKKGDMYMFSYQYNSEDPFQNIVEDSVKVIDIKNGYVLYEWQDKFKIRQHCKESVFRSCCKNPIHNK